MLTRVRGIAREHSLVMAVKLVMLLWLAALFASSRAVWLTMQTTVKLILKRSVYEHRKPKKIRTPIRKRADNQ